MSPDQNDERVRRRAYEIWEREGRPEGREAEHWRMAREEIAAEDAAGAQEVPTAAKSGDVSGETAPPERRPETQVDPLGLAQSEAKAGPSPKRGAPRTTKPRSKQAAQSAKTGNAQSTDRSG